MLAESACEKRTYISLPKYFILIEITIAVVLIRKI